MTHGDEHASAQVPIEQRAQLPLLGPVQHMCYCCSTVGHVHTFSAKFGIKIQSKNHGLRRLCAEGIPHACTLACLHTCIVLPVVHLHVTYPRNSQNAIGCFPQSVSDKESLGVRLPQQHCFQKAE